MAVNIKLKRSNVAGQSPNPSQLELGELALNTADGKAFMKKSDGSVVEIGAVSTSSISASYADTAGFAITAGSSSYSSTATTSSYSLIATSASYAATASYASNVPETASYANNATSASYAITASYAANVPQTASYAISASYATTASSADDFLVRGTLTAQTIVAQYITSSTSFITGSTKFGTISSNTHQFTGSVSISGSLGINGVDYESTSASFDTRILNNSSSIGLLSGSYLASSASFDTRIINNSSSIGLLSGSYLADSASFDTRILNNSSSISSNVSSLNNFSASILNYTASNNDTISALYAATASLYNATASIYATTASLSSSIGSLSSSFLNTSSSLNTRVSDLETFSSSLDSTFATDAQLNYSSSVLSGSTSALSASFLTVSASNSTRISSLEQFSSSLNNTFATDADLNALSSSFIAFTSSINNFTSSVNSYTSSNNDTVSALYAATSSLNNATASLYNFSASINSYTASNNDNITQLYNETASLKAATASLYSATSSLYAFSASLNNFTASQLVLNGKYATTGSNTFIGNEVISGSLVVTQQSNLAFLTASGLIYPTTDGLDGQSIQTDGAGNLFFNDIETIHESVRNGESFTLLKGTPVYVSGSQGANPVVYAADAADPTKMPVIYIIADDLASDTVGRGILLGLITGIDLTGYAAGSEVFVAAGGGWTSTRPTGSAIIQSLGIITKPGNGGQGVVLNPGPANLPNIPSGYVWVGNANNYPIATATSSIQNVISASHAGFAETIANGLNITASNLDVTNNATVGGNLTVNGTASFNYVQTITGSAVIIGQEYIILNTQTPAARYAGIKVYDSGSNTTASIVWDSQTNHWIYENGSGSSYSGGGFMAGPRNTGSLADITYPTQYRVLRGQGGDHLYDSNIVDNDIAIKIGINTEITGGLVVTSGITGSLFGTSSWANYSISASNSLYAGQATSASLAETASFVILSQTASYALNAELLDGLDSTSFVSTGSFGAQTSSFNTFSASINSYTASNNITIQAIYAETASLKATTASLNLFSASINSYTSSVNATITQLQNATASIYATTASLSSSIGSLSSSFLAFSSSYGTGSFSGSFSGSLEGTASYAMFSPFAVYALTASDAVHAYTASSADNFLVRGTLTAQTINVQTITSSVDFVTGSTRFGTLSSNTHQFTGSVTISGSLAVNNSNAILTNQTSSMSVATASYVTLAQSASYWSGSINNALSASYALTASYALNVPVTASYAISASNAISSSFASTASYWSGSINNALSASFASTATSASNALTASFVNPLNQNVQITGSLGISGSTGTLFTANIDTIVFTGSAAISGTLNVTNGITGSLLGTASLATTASYWSGSINNALSSSYALTASFALNVPQTASFAISASQAQNAVSSSFAATASYALNAASATIPFPYINPTTITGSVSIPDNHNGLLVSPISISGSITIGSGSSLLTVGPITSSMSASYAATSSYSTNIIGAANYIAKFSGSNTLSSSIMYENANGIGVNDTSPTHKFQVSGDVSTYNSSNALNLTKYSLIGALNTTVTGTETNQYANVGIYGSLGLSATSSTFTPLDKSFVGSFLGNIAKSGAGNISGKVSSYAAASNLSGTGNVTTLAGFRAYAPLQSFALPAFTGTVTNYIGLLIDDITGNTDVGSQITNKYGVYQAGTSDKNYIAGATTINNVLQLGQLDPLPSGTDGQLAVSASNLYFFSGSAWNKISFA